jgi:UDP-glucose 4-epimerase
VLAEDLVRNYQKLHGLPCSIVRLASVLAPNEMAVVCRLDRARAFQSAHVAARRRSKLWSLFAEYPDVLSELDAAVPVRSDNPALILTGPDGDPWEIHFTDVRDAVAGLMLAIENQAAAGDEFNIAAQRTTRFDEAAQALSTYAHTGVARAALPVRLGFELSIEKARRQLGYAPKWDFASSLASVTTHGRAGELVDYVPVGEA